MLRGESWIPAFAGMSEWYIPAFAGMSGLGKARYYHPFFRTTHHLHRSPRCRAGSMLWTGSGSRPSPGWAGWVGVMRGLS